MQLKAIPERCSGCCTCKLACALANFGQVCPAMAALAIRGQFPAPGTYDILLCDQCGACAEVCPVDAIEEKDDVYLVDAEICIDCGECVEACPHDVMFEHSKLNIPIKCTLCGECVEICPRDALVLEAS
ncbi:MAG: 4Fe-4S binding protein [Desulfobacterales bacterium]|nr:4Fe-4S binding protein [Desulfobacterales bacterium]